MIERLRSAFKRNKTLYENFDELQAPEQAPLTEVSKQWAISKIDAMNNELLQTRAQTLPGNSESYEDYKTYLLEVGSV